MPKGVDPDVNIQELPGDVGLKLVKYIDQNYNRVITSFEDSKYELKDIQIGEIKNESIRGGSPGKKILILQGSRGMKVREFAYYLDKIQFERALKLIRDPEPLRIVKNCETNVEIQEGKTLELTCKARSFPYPEYTWFYSNQEVTGGVNPTLKIEKAKPSHSGKYICRINRRTEVLWSNWVKVTVYPKEKCSVPQPRLISDGRPTIILQPASVQCCFGQSFVLECQARGDFVKYQWMKNGMECTGRTRPQLFVPAAVLNDHGKYKCIVSNRYGEVISQEVEVRIHAGQILEIFDVEQEPHDVEVEQGPRSEVVFHYIVKANFHISYQWFKNGNKLEGENRNVLRVKADTPGSQGQYTCHVKSPDGKHEKVSRPADLKLKMRTDFTATDKVALLIGICDYKAIPNLYFPVNDVMTLREQLQQLDFKVISLSELTNNEIRDAVDLFIDMIHQGSYCLFYFAGHGFEMYGQRYLVPVDSKPGPSPEDCTCAEMITTRMSEKDPALCMTILDICREVPPDAHNNVHSTEQFQPKHRGNTVTLYATALGQKAYEPQPSPGLPEKHGIFLQHFQKVVGLKHDVKKVFQALQDEFSKDERIGEESIQVPELSITLGDRRTLHDKIIYKGHTGKVEKNCILFHSVKTLPEEKKITLSMENYPMELHISYKEVLSNVMALNIAMHGPTLFRNIYYSCDEVPPELVCKEKKISIWNYI